MAFGPKKEDEYPTSMVWKGTEASARDICAWARDDALLPFAAVTPPDRNAAAGTPGAKHRLKIQTTVPPELGGGLQWIDVPEGATILFEGTRVDPTFSIKRPRTREAADTFKE
jgi:hypothetical protein